jgi:hypothetical protein
MGYSMAGDYASQRIVMRISPALMLAALGMSAFLAGSSQAGPREREQETAFRATRDGRFVPLRAIEARIVPAMRGFVYIGPELHADSGRYRLKFLRGVQLVWVDVDARTGEVIGRSGF